MDDDIYTHGMSCHGRCGRDECAPRRALWPAIKFLGICLLIVAAGLGVYSYVVTCWIRG